MTARAAVDAPSPRHDIIVIQDMSLSLGPKPVLSGIDLTVAKGEFVCIVGKSGCGKTTLLRVVAGLVRPTIGKVLHGGQPIQGTRRDVALVFQDYTSALLRWRTAADNVSLALEGQGRPRAERAERVRALLQRVGLADHRDKYPSQLSGGMQQRVQIARCLAQDPTVLLMDEPFGALDALTRQGLQDELLRIVAESGMTVLFVTHDLDEAVYLGDRVIAMRSHPGRIGQIFEIRLSRPRNQLSTPDHPVFRHARHELFAFFQEP
jgi:NitT/TauT family transport system ATP-binding protein